MRNPLKWLILLWLIGFHQMVSAQIVGGSTPTVLHTANPKVDPDKIVDDTYLMDFKQLFAGVNKDDKRLGGIVADNFGTNGRVTLSAYIYDKDAADGKGALIYECYSDRNSTSSTDFVAKPNTRTVRLPLTGNTSVSTTDIVSLLSSNNIYKTTCTRYDSHLTTSAKAALASIAVCWAGCATSVIYSWLTFGAITGGCVIGCGAYSSSLIASGVTTQTEYTPVDYECAANFSAIQKIVVEVSIQNATLRKVKLPVLGAADAATIFKNPGQFRVTVSINGTAQSTINYPTTVIPTYNVQMGDLVSFSIQSDADITPTILGIPSVWLAPLCRRSTLLLLPFHYTRRIQALSGVRLAGTWHRHPEIPGKLAEIGWYSRHR